MRRERRMRREEIHYEGNPRPVNLFVEHEIGKKLHDKYLKMFNSDTRGVR